MKGWGAHVAVDVWLRVCVGVFVGELVSEPVGVAATVAEIEGDTPNVMEDDGELVVVADGVAVDVGVGVEVARMHSEPDFSGLLVQSMLMPIQ